MLEGEFPTDWQFSDLDMETGTREGEMSAAAVDIVAEFWKRMESNDFRSVGTLLNDEFVLDWPQSHERIRGRDNFAAMNEEYPARGRWQFTVNTIVGNDNEAVIDVSVTDGTRCDRAVSFFTVDSGKILKIVEFWPEASPAPEHRRHLVEPLKA